MLFSPVLACQLVLELDFSEGELHHCWYWQKCTQNPCKGIRKVCGLQGGESTPSPASLFLVLSVSCWSRKTTAVSWGLWSTICLSTLGIKRKCPGCRLSAHSRGISPNAHWLSRTILSKILFKTRCSKDDALYFCSVAVLFYFNGNVYKILLLTTLWINKVS